MTKNNNLLRKKNKKKNRIITKLIILSGFLFLLSVSLIFKSLPSQETSTLPSTPLSQFKVRFLPDSKDVYTLYRHSFIVETLSDDRRHIATFYSTNSYNNKYYCDFAVSLFMKQPKRTAKYWCEKGYYKK